MEYLLRPYQDKDYDFVKRMVYEAVFWRLGPERPSLEEGLKYQGLLDALEGYPNRPGDTTLIATLNGFPVGAALYRFWDDEKNIRGYVKKESPVVIIGIDSDHRKKGLGSKLLKELEIQASVQGLKSVSLCVSKDNIAYNLYVKEGYKVYEDIGSSYNMLKEIHRPNGLSKPPISIDEMLNMSHDLFEMNKHDWSPMEPEHARTFILYMIEEIGETISIVKKKGEDQIMNTPEVRERFIEEMCDVMMYYSDVLNRFSITPEEYSSVYRKKFEKNISRNYKKDHAES